MIRVKTEKQKIWLQEFLKSAPHILAIVWILISTRVMKDPGPYFMWGYLMGMGTALSFRLQYIKIGVRDEEGREKTV